MREAHECLVCQRPLSEADTRQQPIDYPAYQWPLATWPSEEREAAWCDLLAQARTAGWLVEDDGVTVALSDPGRDQVERFVKAGRDGYEDAHAWLDGRGIFSAAESEDKP